MLAKNLVPALIAVLLAANGAAAEEANVAGHPKAGQTVAAAPTDTKYFDRNLKEEQLSDAVKEVLGIGLAAGAGTENHPFATKNASADGVSTPVELYPWRAAGKLFMKFGTQTFVCTASVIRKGLLVTAAHCVHNYGKKEEGWADAITFEPARHDSEKPYKTWTAKEWWIPKVYFDGTDKCTVIGVVCENDVAVVVMDRLDGKEIGDVTGQYDFRDQPDYGYVDFLQKKATQITQLGYPSENYDGLKMIRTDSLGYQDDPNNVIIGSDQTGGSSGGPWIENFGMTTSHTGSVPTGNDSNIVVATTSWGFTSDKFKVQGGSRFSKNSKYTTKSNIRSLVDSACAANPGSC